MHASDPVAAFFRKAEITAFFDRLGPVPVWPLWRTASRRRRSATLKRCLRCRGRRRRRQVPARRHPRARKPGGQHALAGVGLSSSDARYMTFDEMTALVAKLRHAAWLASASVSFGPRRAMFPKTRKRLSA